MSCKRYFVFIAMVLFILVGLFSEATAFDSADFNNGGGPLEIVRITPTGEDVPPGRQMVLSFNRPVVPVGRMERDPSEIPITIEPPLKCEWRWLNTSSLACQLTEENKMSPATRYKVTVRPGIKTEDGTTLKKEYRHEFITVRPSVKSQWFRIWESPGTPVIQLRFNQAVTRGSVMNHMYFYDEKRIRHPLIAEEENKKHYRYEENQVWLVKPKAELPLDSQIELMIEPGLESTQGSEPSAENRVVISFATFPEFSFIGVRCSDIKGRSVLFDNKSTVSRRCDPLGRPEMLFSTPVDKESLKKHLAVTPDLAGGRDDYDPWADVYYYASLSNSHRKSNRYSLHLPMLKGFETYAMFAERNKIKDVFDRSLSDDIDMSFMTDHRRPKFFLKSHMFVLEKGVDSEVPLTVTNLNSVSLNYNILTAQGIDTRQKTIKAPQVEDVAFNMPLNTRELLSGRSGALFSTIRTKPHTTDSWFFSQVTPFNVHVKIGHFNTMVWITDFSTGQPVPGVFVDIYKDSFGSFNADSSSSTSMTDSITNSYGIAMLPGTKHIDPDLSVSRYDYRSNEKHFFMRCRKGEDLAIVPLTNSFAARITGTGNTFINSWRRPQYGHIHTWGTTAQGIYRAGDTVQYKLYVRDQNNNRFTPPPSGSYALEVIDPMGKTVHRVDGIALSEFGSYDGEFTVPKTGAVGWYRFRLRAKFGTWEPMRVLVSDFTPAPFRVNTDLNGELFRPGDKVAVQTTARLHSGGPYADAQTRITARLNQKSLRPKDPKANGFRFNVYSSHYRTTTMHQSEESVNEKGDLKTEFSVTDQPVVYGHMMVESAVRDDRGKYVANEASATYAGRDRYVGIRQPDWVLKEDKPAEVYALVVDEFGRITSGTKVDFKVQYRKTTASRVKGAGNAYLTRYSHEWIDVSECKSKSTNEPVKCTFTPEESGSYKITASINDTKGRQHSSTTSRWAIGKGRVLWETRDGNSLQIFPEKEEVNIGDTARYMVQNPFPGAKALITIERYGILKTWVKVFENSTEIVEFPVLPDYLPGYYLSVVIMSPRMDKPIDENDVDLGKPAFRMGYVRVPVNDPFKQIVIDVRQDKKEYRPRDTVTVDLEARPKSFRGKGKLPPMELAVAVLDESVLDLIAEGTNYFDPYKGFYSLDPLDVDNYSLLMQLLGRQHFEKKGADTGGGGGMDIKFRSLFKFVSYWNPSIKTDSEGRARISFQVPDNLTGWRILVMGVTATDRMGLGQGTFTVNRPTEIRPALPNQVTEGDEFQAGFTVMNRTDSRRKLDVTVKAEGPITSGAAQKSLKVQAEPYKRVPVWLSVKTIDDGKVNFAVTAGDNIDIDALRRSMPVRKRVSLQTAATYGTTTSDKVSENIAFPNDIRTDAGAVSVVASSTVIGNVEGAFKYMLEYPYICWEQKLTKGVMAAHYQKLKDYLPEDLKWPESEDLPKDTLELAAEHQAPNGGMVYYRPEDQYVSPYLSAYTALAFNWLRGHGHDIPHEVEKNLHGYLLKLLRRDVMPSFYSKGMSSTVRAVAMAALAPHGKIKIQDLKRYERHVPGMSLFGKAHYLSALYDVKGTRLEQRRVFDQIMTHANQTGGKFIFSEELDSSYQRILASPLRDNCSILSAVLKYSETAQGSAAAGDVSFKLMRTITQTRGNRDHWENTQENMFCMNSLVDFSRMYEKDRPDFVVKAWLDNESMGTERLRGFRDGPKGFERPVQKGDPGRKTRVKLERKGVGRLYYATRLSYALLDIKARSINSGIEVRREYSVERNGEWHLLNRDMRIKAGELVRVDLYVSLPSARNFIVVDDPVPGGLEPVNRDLATASAVDADKGTFKRSDSSFWFSRGEWREYGYSRWSFYHKELRHHAARFYSEYLPAGNYHLSYVAQAIAPGDFTVMPLHAEEMYDPDVFGKGLPASLRVERED
jgi:uncharacterized protein YfaS (alpha-2-macroglobulin family)